MAKSKKIDKTKFDREAAIAAHKQKKIVKEKYSKRNWGLDLTLDELALISATYPSAQQYGPKFEKWINHNVGWKSVPSKLGRGDSQVPKGTVGNTKETDVYIEQKWNIRTDVGPGGLQHRFWQDIDYYLYGHVDDSDSDNIKVDLYLLTKQQVLEEAKLLGSAATHGTKAANKLNENIEYSMSVPYESFHHRRWKDKYLISLEKLKTYEF
jgi:hypothetical protein